MFMTVVVPAYNEEKRLVGMLEEAVNFLETEYGTSSSNGDALKDTTNTSESVRKRKPTANGSATSKNAHKSATGWEILIVNDGSTDATIETAANFIRNHLVPLHPRRMSGPWTHTSKTSGSGEPQLSVSIPAGTIRLVSLETTPGKVAPWNPARPPPPAQNF